MEDKKLIADATAKAQEWLSDKYDAETQKQVQAMLENSDKVNLVESFYKDLEFGTGGLRGIMGAGSNRMNVYTIGLATQGYTNYLLQQFASQGEVKVVIGYDCRNNSKKFAQTVANIFSANGIRVYLFEDLRPTPEISYAIRKLGCKGGVIITASHNPKEYNGYKVYWDDGAQVVTPHDTNIITEVEKVKINDVKFEGNPALIESLGADMDAQFITDLKTMRLSPDSIKRFPNIGIVYTPLHGTGSTIIPQALAACGFTNVIPVPEQYVQSGEFPTVVSPNPEDPAALKMAIAKGEETGADLVFATDPDADRFGAAIRDDKGDFILLNGNQTMLLLVYYIITRKKELGQLTGNEYTVRTIVTSELIQTVSEKNGVDMYVSYTGFKWIASIIRQLEGKRTYIGGGEESFGFMAPAFVRDKDSASAAILFAEIAAWTKDNGRTIYDLLKDIYIEYGFSKELGISVVRKGISGAQEIEAMMKKFREAPMAEIDGSKVVEIKDYLSLETKNIVTGKVTKLDMPVTSNVLQYLTEDKTKVSIRPSGTEPKIKFYLEVHSTLNSRAEFDKVDAEADKRFQNICKSLGI